MRPECAGGTGGCSASAWPGGHNSSYAIVNVLVKPDAKSYVPSSLVICHLSLATDCATFLPMTSKQRCIVAVLVVANAVVVVALVVLVTRPSSTHLSPSPTLPLPHSPTSQQETCQWRATQLLARAGLGGTVALTPDGSLRFEITYSLAPGQTAPENVNESAQLVWTAFDVALALDELAGSGGQEAGMKIQTAPLPRSRSRFWPRASKLMSLLPGRSAQA